MPESNSFLDEANQTLSGFIGTGQQAVGLWSSFLDAKLGYKLGASQLASQGNSGSFSPEQEDALNFGGMRVTASSAIVFAAIALAVIGTGVLIWKQVK